MKKFWTTLVMVFVLSLGSASAATISISQEIHITGVVAPMRFIVLDSGNNIIEITSNTTDDVMPTVKRGSVTDGVEVPLTTAVYEDYLSKIEGKDLQSVDMHFEPQAPTVSTSEKPSWLTALTRISLLRF